MFVKKTCGYFALGNLRSSRIPAYLLDFLRHLLIRSHPPDPIWRLCDPVGKSLRQFLG